MLTPRKVKYRRHHKGKGILKGNATSGHSVAFGSYGIKTLDHGRITPRHIEAVRRVIARKTKRGGKIWIRIFPHTPITEKSEGVPMGSGKGSIKTYIARVKPGHVLFELDGISQELSYEVLISAAKKLPVRTKVVARHL